MRNAKYYGRGDVALTPFTVAPMAWVVTDPDGVELARLNADDRERDTYADALALLGLKRRHGLNLAMARVREWAIAPSGLSNGPGCEGAAISTRDASRASTVVREVRRFIAASVDHRGYVPAPLDTVSAFLFDVLTRGYDAGEISRADLLLTARILTRYQGMLDRAELATAYGAEL